jgi:hypothetical protein
VIKIGTAGTHTSTYIAGINGLQTLASPLQVVIDATTGQLGTISSSRRYKEDIQPMGDASDRLLQLRPVTFRYRKPNANGEKPVQYGLIAEEVAEVLPELVVTNKEGQPETVAYQTLPMLLLNELQKEHAKVEETRTLVREQAEQLAALKAQVTEVDSLRAEVAELRRLTERLAAQNDDSAAKPAVQVAWDK